MSPLQEALEQDGFAIVRGVVPEREVAEMSRGFDRLVERAKSLGASEEVHGSRFVLDAEPFRLHRVVWCGGAEAALARYGDDPRFLKLASEALRSAQLVQLIQQAHFKFPGDGVSFALHQDGSNRRYGTDLWTDVDGRGSFVQITMAVDAMTPENGGLKMLAGTHRLGFVADPMTGALPKNALEGEVVDVRLAPGDVAIFGPFIVHGSAPNRGSSARRLFLQGYALPGANRRMYPGCGLGVPRTWAWGD